MTDCGSVCANGSVGPFYDWVTSHCMSLSTSSSADGHSGCFRVLAVASRTAVRLGPVRHSELRFSLVTCPGMGLLGHMGVLLGFWWTTNCSPQWLYQFAFPPTVWHSVFFPPSPTFIVCRLFDVGHSDQYEVAPHGSFDFRFSDDSDIEHLPCVCWPSVCLLWWNVCLAHRSVYWLGCLLLI